MDKCSGCEKNVVKLVCADCRKAICTECAKNHSNHHLVQTNDYFADLIAIKKENLKEALDCTNKVIWKKEWLQKSRDAIIQRTGSMEAKEVEDVNVKIEELDEYMKDVSVKYGMIDLIDRLFKIVVINEPVQFLKILEETKVELKVPDLSIEEEKEIHQQLNPVNAFHGYIRQIDKGVEKWINDAVNNCENMRQECAKLKKELNELKEEKKKLESDPVISLTPKNSNRIQTEVIAEEIKGQNIINTEEVKPQTNIENVISMFYMETIDKITEKMLEKEKLDKQILSMINKLEEQNKQFNKDTENYNNRKVEHEKIRKDILELEKVVLMLTIKKVEMEKDCEKLKEENATLKVSVDDLKECKENLKRDYMDHEVLLSSIQDLRKRRLTLLCDYELEQIKGPTPETNNEKKIKDIAKLEKLLLHNMNKKNKNT